MDKAEAMLQTMRANGTSPDAKSYAVLLNALVKGRELDRAVRLVDEYVSVVIRFFFGGGGLCIMAPFCVVWRKTILVSLLIDISCERVCLYNM